MRYTYTQILPLPGASHPQSYEPKHSQENILPTKREKETSSKKRNTQNQDLYTIWMKATYFKKKVGYKYLIEQRWRL